MLAESGRDEKVQFMVQPGFQSLIESKYSATCCQLSTRDEAGGGEVVRGGVEQAPAFKAEQVSGLVVDEEVGAQDAICRRRRRSGWAG